MRTYSDMPSFARSRRGHSVSLLDGIVQALWRSGPRTTWPSLSFGELTERASVIVGYEVKGPTVRSYVYRRPDLFERADDTPAVRWRLTREAKGSD
jgi:hypothetical protein